MIHTHAGCISMVPCIGSLNIYTNRQFIYTLMELFDELLRIHGIIEEHVDAYALRPLMDLRKHFFIFMHIFLYSMWNLYGNKVILIHKAICDNHQSH